MNNNLTHDVVNKKFSCCFSVVVIFLALTAFLVLCGCNSSMGTPHARTGHLFLEPISVTYEDEIQFTVSGEYRNSKLSIYIEANNITSYSMLITKKPQHYSCFVDIKDLQTGNDKATNKILLGYGFGGIVRVWIPEMRGELKKNLRILSPNERYRFLLIKLDFQDIQHEITGISSLEIEYKSPENNAHFDIPEFAGLSVFDGKVDIPYIEIVDKRTNRKANQAGGRVDDKE